MTVNKQKIFICILLNQKTPGLTMSKEDWIQNSINVCALQNKQSRLETVVHWTNILIAGGMDQLGF